MKLKIKFRNLLFTSRSMYSKTSFFRLCFRKPRSRMIAKITCRIDAFLYFFRTYEMPGQFFLQNVTYSTLKR